MKSPIDQMASVVAHERKVRQMFAEQHITNSGSRKPYDGKELRPYEGRPGSMDAYALPSVVDGKDVPYTGIHPQCVGVSQAQPFSYPRGSEG